MPEIPKRPQIRAVEPEAGEHDFLLLSSEELEEIIFKLEEKNDHEKSKRK